MAKPAKRSNPIVLRRDMNIGSISAENDDEFLFDCFVHHPAVGASIDTHSPGMILAGRTGSGKTAVLRRIEHTAEHCAQVDPSDSPF